MQVEYKGTQYVHKFSNGEEVKYITCSNEEFKNIKEKPSLEGYEYQYTVGGMVEVDTPGKLLGEGETTEIDGNVIVSCKEVNGVVEILTDKGEPYVFPVVEEVVEQVVDPVEESNQTYAE
jgi:hypothetical protein